MERKEGCCTEMKQNRIMLVDDVIFSVKAVADYLLEIVHGKQAVPYQPKPTVFNLYAGHLTKTEDEKLDSEVWVGQLFLDRKSVV
jgi:hypothetical protein